jgi:hypothetical protein
MMRASPVCQLLQRTATNATLDAVLTSGRCCPPRQLPQPASGDTSQSNSRSHCLSAAAAAAAASQPASLLSTQFVGLPLSYGARQRRHQRQPHLSDSSDTLCGNEDDGGVGGSLRGISDGVNNGRLVAAVITEKKRSSDQSN